jgi:CRISPR-associated endonuclease/helicase Cas3
LEASPLQEEGAVNGGFRKVLRWRGPEGSSIAVGPQDVRPGDTLVVPAIYGGCDTEGWNPPSREPVADLADAARLAARKPVLLRVHPSLPLPEMLRPWSEFRGEEWPSDLQSQLCKALQAVEGEREIVALCTLLAKARRLHVERHPSGLGLVLSCDLRPSGSDTVDFSGEDDTSARAIGTVKLADHLTDVEAKAVAIAKAVGLPSGLVEDLALAARLHDVGKADPRFQGWISGGSRLRPGGLGLLAKSARMPADAAAMKAARERAGYPEGGRHELLSVRLVESAPAILATAHDGDLVLHLVESHHGHCRPFAPVVFDARPPSVSVPKEIAGELLSYGKATGLERLDSGVPDRFWSLVRKYGWWGLSYLEACLRLADHRASENPAHHAEEEV